MRGGPRGFTPGFTGLALLGNSPRDSNLSLTRLSLSMARLFQPVQLGPSLLTLPWIRSSTWSSHDTRHATPAGLTHDRFRLIPFRSPLLGESMFLSFPAGTEMVQFPAFPTTRYGFTRRSRGFTSGRFRISEIPGSKPACGSPRLIAATPRLSSALGA